MKERTLSFRQVSVNPNVAAVVSSIIAVVGVPGNIQNYFVACCMLQLEAAVIIRQRAPIAVVDPALQRSLPGSFMTKI